MTTLGLISITIEMKTTTTHHDLARVMRALAHPNRLAIFERIHRDSTCCHADAKGNTVCAIADDFDLALSTVSHHLKELRDAELVSCERQGQQVLCRINYETVNKVLALLSGTRPAARRRRRGEPAGA